MKTKNLSAFACVNGHTLYSENDLTGMICPECLGAPKDPAVFLTWQLAPVQEKKNV
jgi:hypothetical protein